MKFGSSDDDMMIADIAARYLRERTARRRDGHDPALWAEFAEMGWLAMPLDEAHGGIGASAQTLGILLEAFGRERVNEPYATGVLWSCDILQGLPQGRPKTLMTGELIAAIADGSAIPVVIDAGISAHHDGSGYRLDGTAALVVGGDCATVLLVAVQGDNGPILFCVPAQAPGLVIDPVATIDGSGAADIRFDAVAANEVLDAGGTLEARLSRSRDRTAALLCADAVGAMAVLLEKTAAYVATRQQFGKPLRGFQVVDHFLADMQTLVEEARSATLLALAKIDAPPVQRRRALSAARVKIGIGARTVGHQAVQLHGAMGVTDELDIGAYLKRLIAFDVTVGTRDGYLDVYAGLARAGDAGDYLADDAETDAYPDFGLSPVAADERTAIRAFLAQDLPDDLRRAVQMTPTVYPEVDIAQRWHRIAHRRGWGAPNWPAEFGGAGWDAERRYVWAQESNRAHVPITSAIGLQLVGPVLMHYGTPAQQQRYLPAIVDGSEIWCQGFSEPGAGSDLASLAMRAVREGDHYVVTGTKIWTTHGHFADQMAALVRTGAPGGRRDGISFLIIDMKSAGIDVRPILTIGGDHEVNQIFFDAVKVPADNLVGEEGQGWAIAKFLLEHERGGEIMSAGHRALMRDIRVAAIARGETSDAFWRAFATVAIDIDILEVTELRALFGVAGNDAVPSILKLRASEIQQAVTELGARLLGADAVRRYDLHASATTSPHLVEQAFAARYLNSRANTIFGGAREIQKALIARSVA